MQIKGKVSSKEIQRYCTLLHEIRTKTEEDIQTYFASGRFNDISVGYLLYALEQIGCKKEDIIKIIQTYRLMLDTITTAEALTKVQAFEREAL